MKLFTYAFAILVAILASNFQTIEAKAGTLCPDGTYVAADSCTLTPDGRYVGGDNYTLCPDGRYVGGDSCTLTPDGDYVGGEGSTLCPDGTYVGGDECYLSPDGDYVGNDGRPGEEDSHHNDDSNDYDDNDYYDDDDNTEDDGYNDDRPSRPVIEIPRNEWLYCSGFSNQPDYCYDIDVPHIFVKDNYGELFGLACGSVDTNYLSIFSVTSGAVSGPESESFSMTIQVEGYRSQSLNNIAFYPARRISSYLGRNIPNTLVTQIIKGYKANIEIFNDSGNLVHTNSYSLTGSAAGIRKLRKRCKTDE